MVPVPETSLRYVTVRDKLLVIRFGYCRIRGVFHPWLLIEISNTHRLPCFVLSNFSEGVLLHAPWCAWNDLECSTTGALADLLPFPSIRYSQLRLSTLILISAHMGLLPLAFTKNQYAQKCRLYFLLSRCALSRIDFNAFFIHYSLSRAFSEI